MALSPPRPSTRLPAAAPAYHPCPTASMKSGSVPVCLPTANRLDFAFSLSIAARAILCLIFFAVLVFLFFFARRGGWQHVIDRDSGQLRAAADFSSSVPPGAARPLRTRGVGPVSSWSRRPRSGSARHVGPHQ